MKLDNIIYDVNSLSSALTEQWNIESPTFKASYPSDTATALVNGLSAYGSMLQYNMTSNLANCYTPTAFSETGIYQLAQTLGNELHGNVSATVMVNITRNNLIGKSLTIPEHSQFEISGKKFFNPSGIIFPANVETVTEVVLVEGEFLEVNKTTSGIENEKFYFAEDFKVNHNYVTVKVNGEEWTVANSFLPYDKNYVVDPEELNVVVLKTDPDGKSYIKVGNNQLGNLPISGSNLQIQYVASEGSAGNIAENNLIGSLSSTLTYLDTNDQQVPLDLTVNTITTAYGGFDHQSIDILRYTSPYIFASGYRAVRRQDYEALLENQCGYLTAAVWGEYEEADKIGAYDSLMMNMVYYTGIKDFQTYPYYSLGTIYSTDVFEGMLNSTRGFWGSFSIHVDNLRDSTSRVTFQDSGAKGFLFINDDSLDPRDSMLPDWKGSSSVKYTAQLLSSPIVSQGTGYSVNDELQLVETNSEVKIRVTSIGTSGDVTGISLLRNAVSQDWTSSHPQAFTTSYVSSGSGTGLTVRIVISSTQASTVIYTNDDHGMVPAPAQMCPIINARSDQPNDLYYQSVWAPSLLQPVQLIVDFGTHAKAIAGVKFKAPEPAEGKFFGTIAMFGTNIDPMPSLENVRNSKDWTRLIDRTPVSNPYGNSNQNWTDWFATNCFTGEEDENTDPVFNTYRYYVIEFYSTENEGDTTSPVTFSKVKFLYSDQSSVIYYMNNGKTRIKFPIAGDPGPGGTEEGYLNKSLLNSASFPMYGYNVTIDGVTAGHGYRNGNILTYNFQERDVNIRFVIEVTNIDNGVFKVTIDGSEVLTGTKYIELAQPASLDDTLVYRVNMVLRDGKIPTEKGGKDYKVNDIVSLNDTSEALKLRITSVDNSGCVLSAVWVSDLVFGAEYNGEYETTLISSSESSKGSGLKVTVNSTPCSGHDGIAGSGGTISITSDPNLGVSASFTGNRIDSASINRSDQPIIDKYNHFTTFLEFKQPEVVQVEIAARVSLAKNAPVSSGIILQNVRNNVTKLFDITPDYIGKGLKLSDIYQAIKSTEYVDWCKVNTPLDNIEINKNGLMILASLDITEVPASFK